MARERNGERVLGPYYESERNRWRIVVVEDGGARNSRFYPTEEEARTVIDGVKRELKELDDTTVTKAIDDYETYLKTEKENRAKSYRETVRRLRAFFEPVREDLVTMIDAKRAVSLYEVFRGRMRKDGNPISVDYHRNALAESKTFLGWCVGKRWLGDNPLDGVEGKGKRRHGKPQLRVSEARKWIEHAVWRANQGEDGAVAAMVTLLMGLRASEIVTRVVRDVDDDGKLLWIPDSKTDAGRRTLQVPAVLQPLLQRLAADRIGNAPLFVAREGGHHDRDWVREWVRRICDQAGVVKVCAHGMRGLHSTLAVEHGVTGHVVAAALGHESVTTTFESYASPNAVASARQNRALSVLAGGKL